MKKSETVTGTAPSMPGKPAKRKPECTIKAADNGGIIVEIPADNSGNGPWKEPTRNVYASYAEAEPAVRKVFGATKKS
ncbi:hypothetical protein LLG88_13760 [bacterium]|nr:hypothetical protein [bacterium]